jgi:hypothetical protein
MDDNQAQFLPYHAINEFMVSEYRHQVLTAVFNRFDRLPGVRRSAINSLVKRHIQVPGFRNSAHAPAGVKARAAAATFEKNPNFAAQVLQGWSELHPELREQVHAFLTAREWQLLPAEADRSQLPGFLPEWPEGQDYDVLGAAFAEMYPDAAVEENDLRLMIVWLAGRLPYDMYGDEEDEGQEEDAEDGEE